MKKKESSITNLSLRNVDDQLRGMQLEETGERDQTLTGRLHRVVTVFNMIRPLLLILATFPILKTSSRTAISVFLQSLDTLSVLAQPVGGDDVADFKAGRDL